MSERDTVQFGECPVCGQEGVVSQSATDTFVGKPVREMYDTACFDADQGFLVFHGTPKDDSEQCDTCLGRGYVTRRYGTVGSGPAARTYRDPCPECSDEETVQSSTGTDRSGGEDRV